MGVNKTAKIIPVKICTAKIIPKKLPKFQKYVILEFVGNQFKWKIIFLIWFIIKQGKTLIVSNYFSCLSLIF